MSLFLINGSKYPTPSRNGFSYETQRLVEGLRSTRGEDISQPIGIELEKLNLVWAVLSAADWEMILRDKQKHRVSVTYWSTTRSAVVTREFYWGNTSAEVLEWEDIGEIRRPKTYMNCAVNLIDSGKA